MADQKRWFKVWTSLAVDMDHLPNDVIGAWTRLGCRAALVGTGGVVTFANWEHLGRFLGVTSERAQELAEALPSVSVEGGKSQHGDLTVTFKNWTKYQEDSTQAERAKASRSKRRGEEKRREETRRERGEPHAIAGGSDAGERRPGQSWQKHQALKGQHGRKVAAGGHAVRIPPLARAVVDAWTAGFRVRFHSEPEPPKPWELEALVDLIHRHGEPKVLEIVEGCLRAGGTKFMRDRDRWGLRTIADEWNVLVAMSIKGDLR